MKKVEKLLLLVVAVCATLIFSSNVAKAESYLYLNNLEFNVQVNEDASINITEYWDIDIDETNTLYKIFKTDNTKYTGITDVNITDITDARTQKLIKQNNWAYHVDKGKYYGTKNSEGDFEIGWGVGLDNDYDTRKYKIEYKVENAIAKYNDFAELYWQLIGEDFEISADIVKGTIWLPKNAQSKENIKVWGHIETLNGTIHVTDLNKIEFKVDEYESNNMLEIRTLFPAEMIISSAREQDIDILQTVIEEETKWVEEANARREARKNTVTIIIGLAALILNICFIITIIRANKSPIMNQIKFVPEQKMEYYRDVPRQNATPGEAVSLMRKNMTEYLNYDEIGKIFSAVLLNLKLKGYLEFEIDENKKEKEKISIKMLGTTNGKELLGEEKVIYDFLEEVTLRKGKTVLNIKELQKAIKSNSTKVAKLGENMGKTIHSRIVKENLLDKQQASTHSNAIGVIVVQIVCLLFLFLFSGIMTVEIGLNPTIIATIVIITSLQGMISIIKKIGILRKANPFTQMGVNEIEAWKGLKKYMEDFSLLNEREVPEIEIWERFLVFATSFGIAEKVIKQLKIVCPDLEQLTGNNYTTMYLMMNTDFSSSFSSAISSSISSTYSSATGGGGGFSGGGGGGGGRRWRRRTLITFKYNFKIE